MIRFEDLINKIKENSIGDEEFNNFEVLMVIKQNFSTVCLAFHQNTSIKTLKLERLWDFAQDQQAINTDIKALSELLKVNSSITELDLNMNRTLGPKRIKWIAKGLRRNRFIKALNLEATSCMDKGAISLARMLKKNTTITMLSLNENFMTSAGVGALTNALKNHPSIRQLELKNLLSNMANVEERLDVAKSIAELITSNTLITHIDLGYNDFHLDCIRTIAKALKPRNQLISFSFSGNIMSNEACYLLFEALSYHPNLKYITLRHSSNIDLNCMKMFLKNNQELTSLAVSLTIFSRLSPILHEILAQNRRLISFEYVGNFREINGPAGLFHNTTDELLDKNSSYVRKGKDSIFQEINKTGLIKGLRSIIYEYLAIEDVVKEENDWLYRKKLAEECNNLKTTDGVRNIDSGPRQIIFSYLNLERIDDSVLDSEDMIQYVHENEENSANFSSTAAQNSKQVKI